jgi:hypothetical protein
MQPLPWMNLKTMNFKTMNLSVSPKTYGSPGQSPRVLLTWVPDYTFPWVFDYAYPIAALRNGASISQRMVQIQGLVVTWRIIRS